MKNLEVFLFDGALCPRFPITWMSTLLSLLTTLIRHVSISLESRSLELAYMVI